MSAVLIGAVINIVLDPIFIFTELKLHRIEAYVTPDNNASIHLLKKLEFTEEGIAHGLSLIHICFAA